MTLPVSRQLCIARMAADTASLAYFCAALNLMIRKETLQPQLSERRQKIVRERLDEWCAAKGYRDTSLNMITLSRSLNISRYELSRYLSSCLNTTFRPWLAEVRFEAAKKMMLDNPDFGNDIISAECGFSSRTHLYRMFKEKEGCSPTAWREKNC